MTLSPHNDAMGKAISDYFNLGKASKLIVRSSMFDDDEMPVPYLFRTIADLPPLELHALKLARGKVLDIGAGAGCHALMLQEQGFDVTAIDISPLSCEVMETRGVKHVVCCDVMEHALAGRFDTILLLMNGIGMAGTVDRLPKLLARLKMLLADGGQIITDSTDLKYVFENEDDSIDIDLSGRYYGEVDYQMVYKDIEGKPFDWLYIDYPLLCHTAQMCGLGSKLEMEGDHYDYLARLTLA